jgi:hypothetical protein
MFWWGHYISLQYFVENNEHLPSKLAALRHTDLVVLMRGDLFNNQLDHEDFVPVKQFTATNTELPVTKICTKVPFTELENLQQHVRSFMEHLPE